MTFALEGINRDLIAIQQKIFRLSLDSAAAHS